VNVSKITDIVVVNAGALVASIRNSMKKNDYLPKNKFL